MYFWINKEKLKPNEFMELFEKDSNNEEIYIIRGSKVSSTTYKLDYRINNSSYCKEIPSFALFETDCNQNSLKSYNLLLSNTTSSFDNTYNTKNRLLEGKNHHLIGRNITQYYSSKDIFEFLNHDKYHDYCDLNEDNIWNDFVNTIISRETNTDISKNLKLKLRKTIKKSDSSVNFQEHMIKLINNFFTNDYREAYSLAFCSVYKASCFKYDNEKEDFQRHFSNSQGNLESMKTLRFSLQVVSAIMKLNDNASYFNSSVIDNIHNALILFEILFSTKEKNNINNDGNNNLNNTNSANNHYNYLFNISLEFFYNRFSNNLIKADIKLNSFQQTNYTLSNLNYFLLKKELELNNKKRDILNSSIIEKNRKSINLLTYKLESYETKKHMTQTYSLDLLTRMLDYFGFSLFQKETIYSIFTIVEMLLNVNPILIEINDINNKNKFILKNFNFLYDFICNKFELDKSVLTYEEFYKIFCFDTENEIKENILNLCYDLVYMLFIFVLEKVKLVVYNNFDINSNINSLSNRDSKGIRKSVNSNDNYVKVLVFNCFSKSFNNNDERYNTFQEYLFSQVASKSFNKKFNTGKIISKQSTPEINQTFSKITTNFTKLLTNLDYASNTTLVNIKNKEKISSQKTTNNNIKSEEYSHKALTSKDNSIYKSLIKYLTIQNTAATILNKNDFLKQTFVLSKYYSSKDSFYIFNTSEFIINNETNINKLHVIQSLLNLNNFLDKVPYMHEADIKDVFDAYKILTISEKIKPCNDLKELLLALNIEPSLYDIKNKTIKFNNKLYKILEEAKAEFVYKINQIKLIKCVGVLRILMIKKKILKMRISQIKIKYYWRKYYGMKLKKHNEEYIINDELVDNCEDSEDSGLIVNEKNAENSKTHKVEGVSFKKFNEINLNDRNFDRKNYVDEILNTAALKAKISNPSNDINFQLRVNVESRISQLNTKNKDSTSNSNENDISELQNLNNFDIKSYVTGMLKNVSKKSISHDFIDKGFNYQNSKNKNNFNEMNNQSCKKLSINFIDQVLNNQTNLVSEYSSKQKVEESKLIKNYTNNNNSENNYDLNNQKYQYYSFSQIKEITKETGIKAYFELLVDDCLNKAMDKKKTNNLLNNKYLDVGRKQFKAEVKNEFSFNHTSFVSSVLKKAVKNVNKNSISEFKYGNNINSSNISNDTIKNFNHKIFIQGILHNASVKSQKQKIELELNKINIPNYVESILANAVIKKSQNLRLTSQEYKIDNNECFSATSWKKGSNHERNERSSSSRKNSLMSKKQNSLVKGWKMSLIDSLDNNNNVKKGKLASKRKSEVDFNKSTLTPNTETKISNNFKNSLRGSISTQKKEMENSKKNTAQRKSVQESLQHQIKIHKNSIMNKNNTNNKNITENKTLQNFLITQKYKHYSELDYKSDIIQNKFKQNKIRTYFLKLRLSSLIIQRNFRKLLIKKYDLPENYFFNEKYLRILNSRYSKTLSKYIKTLFPLTFAEEHSKYIKNELYKLQLLLNELECDNLLKQEVFNNKISEMSSNIRIPQNILINFYSFFINTKFKPESNLRSYYALRNPSINFNNNNKIYLFTKIIDFDLIVDIDEIDKFDFSSEFQFLNDYCIKNNCPISNIELGNYHCLVSNNKGKVFSFGWNNEGQCGFSKFSSVINKEELGDEYLVDTNEFNEVVIQNVNYISNIDVYDRVNNSNDNDKIKENPNKDAAANSGKDSSISNYNNYNNLLFGLNNSIQPKFILFDEITHVKEMSCGEEQSFVLDDNGNIWVFGNNENGQLGLGHCDIVEKPTKLLVFNNIDYNNINTNKQISEKQIVKFSYVKTEGTVTFAISKEGNLYMWPTLDKNGKIISTPIRINITSPNFKNNVHNANNIINVNNNSNEIKYSSQYSQTNLNTFRFSNLPTKEIFSDISCGSNFVILKTQSGLLYSFGKSNIYGQLGHGDTLPRSRPSLIDFFLTNKLKIDQVSCGFKHVLVKTSTEKVFSWGLGIKGQLGSGDFCSSALPQQVLAFKNYKVFQVAAGFDCSYFLIEGRKMYVCGGKVGCNIPEFLNVYEKYPEFSNESNYSFVKIYCTWNKFFSILFITIADSTTVNQKEVFKTNRLLNEIAQKWNGNSCKIKLIILLLLLKLNLIYILSI